MIKIEKKTCFGFLCILMFCKSLNGTIHRLRIGLGLSSNSRCAPKLKPTRTHCEQFIHSLSILTKKNVYGKEPGVVFLCFV